MHVDDWKERNYMQLPFLFTENTTQTPSALNQIKVGEPDGFCFWDTLERTLCEELLLHREYLHKWAG